MKSKNAPGLILPCPNGDDPVFFFKGEPLNPTGYQLACVRCEKNGPFAPTQKEAAEKWNSLVMS